MDGNLGPPVSKQEKEDMNLGKTAVITDSNSGITQLQAKKLPGLFVLPMPFMIDGETYFEDIDLTQEEFYERLAKDADISTSQPSPEDVTGLWKQVLGKYEEIVHIPMSSGLSGSCQTAMMLASEFEGRVFVVNNQRISVTQRQSALDALELVKSGKSAEQIKEYLENSKFESSIYIMVDTLKYLKKGGRITPAAAALGTLLKLKPVLQIQGEKLDAFAKARTVKQAKSIMIEALRSDIENRFGGFTEEKEVWIQAAYSGSRENALEFIEQVKKEFPEYEIHVDPLSLSVACHIGPGALAVATTKKIVL